MTALSNRHHAAGWLIALAIVCGLALSQLFGRTAQHVELEWLERPRPVAAFTLVSTQGEITDAALRGHWQLLALGFTHCPDLCPTTLAQLAALQATMADDPVRVIFVSVDPERDSPARLAAYAQFFGTEFIGITGELEQLQRLAHSLGMDFRHDRAGDGPGDNLDDNPDDSSSISHSPTIALIGPDGTLRGRLRPGFDTQQAARELTARMQSPS